jgi:CysZ protein
MVTLPMLPLLLVPIVGEAIFFVFSAYLNGMDFVDMVLSRKGHTWNEKKAWMKQHRSLMMGLGTGLSVILVIPLTTVLALPVGAVASTIAVIDAEHASI